jgi:transcriptional regulator with XRE-family HTH domain
MNDPKDTTNESTATAAETPEQRVKRIYKAKGGPLVGWLEDEARRRRHTFEELARELNVTYGYVAQLRRGIRPTKNISAELAQTCSRYLGVPPIVVKLVAGIFDIRDFAFPYETEEQLVERALQRMLDDPKVRAALPLDVHELPMEAKKALVLLRAGTTAQEILHSRELPHIVRWLQRAAMEHNERELDAHREA